MQPLISGYAVPVLEEQTMWGTDDETRTAYLDTQDVAKMTLAVGRRPLTHSMGGALLTLGEALTHLFWMEVHSVNFQIYHDLRKLSTDQCTHCVGGNDQSTHLLAAVTN